MPPLIAQIALDVPVPKLFDYTAPTFGYSDVGRRVRVPFGRKEMIGVVMSLQTVSAHPLHQLKCISEILDEEPVLSGEILKLLRFCSEYYHYPLGPTVLAALPTALRRNRMPLPRPQYCWRITATGRLCAAQLPARAHVQRAMYGRLVDGDWHATAEFTEISATSRTILNAWLAAAWVEQSSVSSVRDTTRLTTDALPDLNAEQAAAVAQIGAKSTCFQPFLLHGVTGSGKTEVYLRATQTVLDEGGQVLILVPEINLTPQLIGLFRARFANMLIAVLHSGMSDRERLQHWRAASANRARIVLGTRLAIFTPMPRLSLIIVDEEHDSSFYQQESLRYAARDVAIIRAQQRSCPVVLGSATPSLETWHNARNGRYRLLSLRNRAVAAAQLPPIRLIDSRTRKSSDGLSPDLADAIRSRLQKHQQSLIFINRRGYAPTLVCRACAWAAGCERCSARLVVHLRARQLRCHHCGYAQTIVPSCPNCGNIDLTPSGLGTQRMEQILQQRFPSARILRIDRDSTQAKGSWESMQQTIRRGETDILVGTQLLTKGHDFPDLTLVGVIGADNALYSPDFRAGERMFAQLMQVSGRAGRAQHPGEVLIQTEFADHPLYRALQRHDYADYAQTLMEERHSAGFPPFVHQAVLRAEALQLADGLAFLSHAQQCAPKISGITLFDPTAAAMPRKANLERALLLVQSSNRRALQGFLSAWVTKLYALRATRLRWHLDVDPLEI